MARRALWTDTRVSEAIVNAGQARVSLMSDLDSRDSEGMTAVRTILELSVTPPPAVSDGYMRLDLGVGVVSQEAFLAGIVPDPDVVLDRPPRGWLYEVTARWTTGFYY